MGNTGKKKMFVFLGLFFHAAVLVRGGTCAFTLKIVNTLIKKQLTRRLAFDLDIEAIHRQPASCRARPVNVDDGLEDIRRYRGLGSEKLPAASDALLPSLKKRRFFAIGESSRIFVACSYKKLKNISCQYDRVNG